MTEQTGTPTEEDAGEALARQAVDVLTAIARQTRVRGAGTPAAAAEPIDFADVAASVLTAVAANLGSTGTLLSGRPGSWEADLVRQLVDRTAGEDVAALVPWRTEPVRLYVDAYDEFVALGIADMYDAEEAPFQARVADDSLPQAERDAAEDFIDAMSELFEEDQRAYTAAYLDTAARYLAELGGRCGVELGRETAPYAWDGLADTIEDYARQHTPLPMTGRAPETSDGTPADALRRAGLTYTARVEAAQRGDR